MINIFFTLPHIYRYTLRKIRIKELFFPPCRIRGSIHPSEVRYFLRIIQDFRAKMIHAQPVSDAKKPRDDLVAILKAGFFI